MPIAHIQPPGLMKPQGWAQVVVATGGRSVFVAGQGAYAADGKLVGAGDHRAQAEQATRNLLTALESAGASPADLVKLTIYVVGLGPAALNACIQGARDATGGTGLPVTASTLVGVERLARDEMLVEIDAIAVAE